MPPLFVKNLSPFRLAGWCDAVTIMEPSQSVSGNRVIIYIDGVEQRPAAYISQPAALSALSAAEQIRSPLILESCPSATLSIPVLPVFSPSHAANAVTAAYTASSERVIPSPLATPRRSVPLFNALISILTS